MYCHFFTFMWSNFVTYFKILYLLEYRGLCWYCQCLSILGVILEIEFCRNYMRGQLDEYPLLFWPKYSMSIHIGNNWSCIILLWKQNLKSYHMCLWMFHTATESWGTLKVPYSGYTQLWHMWYINIVSCVTVTQSCIVFLFFCLSM